MRQQIIINQDPSISSNPRAPRWSATFAKVAILAIAAVATPELATTASALPFGFFNDSRPVYRRYEYQRPPSPFQRPARAPRAKDKRATNPAPAANELLAKAKGPLHLIISLDKQQLTLYSGGEAIARTRISSGTRGRATPTGVFSVIQKSRWHRSNLYDNAPMFFMHRITWSGVALHQGIVPNYPASHGCVRMPASFARQLWGVTKMGARVIIAHGEVAPVAISHPHLFAPKRAPEAAVSSIDLQKAADRALKMAQAASLETTTDATAVDAAKPADAASDGAASDGAASDDASKPAPSNADTPNATQRPLKPGPVSVFISRKAGKLFVRKGFEPLFDQPITIDRPDEPLGTHVFTAISADEDAGMRWTVVSMPSAKVAAAAALDRITIPQDALDRISALIGPGASLIVSDQGLGPETGRGTDFIVLTK